MILEANVDGRRVRVEVEPRAGGYDVSLDERRLRVDAVPVQGPLSSLLIDGRSHEVAVERSGDGFQVHFPQGSVAVALAAAGGTNARVRHAAGPARLTAPMPGRVVRVLAAVGAAVEAGQGLVVVEAMKMENELRAPRAGRVQQIAVSEGQAVEAGALLLVVA